VKKKTSNAQCRTPNIEFGTWRLSELPDGEYARNHKPTYIRRFLF